MANIKQTILKKKIGEVIYDLMVKTTSQMVYVDDTTTLATKLSAMIADIDDSKTKLATLIGAGEAKAITTQIDEAIQAAREAMENDSDPQSLAGKIKAVADAVAAINNESTGILATAKSYTDEKVAAITAAFAGAFHFKGIVNYIDLLPTGEVSEGDVYQVKYRGTSEEAGVIELNAEYAYNGTEFVELGSIVDLSNYSTTEQVTAAISTAKTAAIEAAASDATTKVEAAKTEINAAVATKARFIVSETQPEDLTEADVWAQVVTA